MQINIGHLDSDGVYNGQFSTFALAGNVRAMVGLFQVYSCTAELGASHIGQ